MFNCIKLDIKRVCLLFLSLGWSNLGSAETMAYSASLNPETLKQVIINSHCNSFVDCLKAIKTKFPEPFSTYTLIYKSNSLQESSMDEPRVLLANADGRMFITFNGGTHRRGGDAIEVLAFDDVTATYNLFEIAIKSEHTSKSQVGLPLASNEIEFENNNIRISKNNPQRCTQCHGKDNTQPFWENYFLWPGVFGSNDDFNQAILFDAEKVSGSFGGNTLEIKESQQLKSTQGRIFNFKNPNADPEFKGFYNYVNSIQQSHSRYSLLEKRVTEIGFKLLTLGKDLTKPLLQSEELYGEKGFSNSDITTLFGMNQNIQLKREIEKNNRSDLFLIAGLLNNCVPKPVEDTFGMSTLPNDQKMVENQHARLAGQLKKILKPDDLKKVLTGETYDLFLLRRYTQHLKNYSRKLRSHLANLNSPQIEFEQHSFQWPPIEYFEKNMVKLSEDDLNILKSTEGPESLVLDFVFEKLGINLHKFDFDIARLSTFSLSNLSHFSERANFFENMRRQIMCPKE